MPFLMPVIWLVSLCLAHLWLVPIAFLAYLVAVVVIMRRNK